MSPQFYQILHLLSIIVLTGGTFYGFAGAPESRKKVMIFTGIAALLTIITGFGLIAKLGHDYLQGWLIVKLVCWLGLSGLAGIGYRKRGQAGLFMTIILALVLTALVMVYQRPF